MDNVWREEVGPGEICSEKHYKWSWVVPLVEKRVSIRWPWKFSPNRRNSASSRDPPVRSWCQWFFSRLHPHTEHGAAHAQASRSGGERTVQRREREERNKMLSIHLEWEANLRENERPQGPYKTYMARLMKIRAAQSAEKQPLTIGWPIWLDLTKPTSAQRCVKEQKIWTVQQVDRTARNVKSLW
jgi:hypothetical protein